MSRKAASPFSLSPFLEGLGDLFVQGDLGCKTDFATKCEIPLAIYHKIWYNKMKYLNPGCSMPVEWDLRYVFISMKERFDYV